MVNRDVITTNELRIGVSNLQKRGALALEGLLIGDVVTHLDAELFGTLGGNEINLLTIKHTCIDLISSSPVTIQSTKPAL